MAHIAPCRKDADDATTQAGVSRNLGWRMPCKYGFGNYIMIFVYSVALRRYGAENREHMCAAQLHNDEPHVPMYRTADGRLNATH